MEVHPTAWVDACEAQDETSVRRSAEAPLFARLTRRYHRGFPPRGKISTRSKEHPMANDTNVHWHEHSVNRAERERLNGH
ncbi:MAG TPA: hypothetical protein VGN42_28300, partial [Pirellulales bacterium]|nr:hypothetical protein [Pirellulales bacterium]